MRIWTNDIVRLLLAVAMSFGGAVPAAAQILPQQATPQQTTPLAPGMPAGSPLNPGDARERTTDGSASQPAVTGERIDPVEVDSQRGTTSGIDTVRSSRVLLEPNPRLKPLAPPNEFEQFVERTIGRRLPRFGSDLLLPSNRDYATPATATVPPGYVLNIGDRIQISMTGSIEGSVQREIDTNGRIFLPRVGSIRLAGVRYGDLKDRLASAIGTKFRNFTVNVGIADLRGVRVYVTGFANNPGAYTVNSLSTLVNAVLAAGGPSAGGSLAIDQALSQ